MKIDVGGEFGHDAGFQWLRWTRYPEVGWMEGADLCDTNTTLTYIIIDLTEP